MRQAELGVGLATLLALVAVACGSSGGVVEARGSVAHRAAAADATPTAVAAIDDLGVALYQQLVDGNDDNLVLSPYSVEVALAMARNGANGATRAEIDRVLGAPAGSELDKSLNALDRVLESRNGSRTAYPNAEKARTGKVALEGANAVFAQDDLGFKKPFLDALSRDYDAGLRLVDFSGATERARKQINGWVAKRTHDKIPELLTKGALRSDHRLVLVNALYFKAPWKEALEDYGDRPFHRLDGSSPSVPMMEYAPKGGESIGNYGFGPGWKAAEIPYLGDELSMVIIVPDDLGAFEKGLTGAQLREITGSFLGPLTQLTMPTFTTRTATSLRKALIALGMPQAFGNGADFSGITSEEQLAIDDVVHEGYIAVDREGTEAAASTAVMFYPVSGFADRSEVHADRPFLFVVRDRGTGAVLFLGRITDPKA